MMKNLTNVDHRERAIVAAGLDNYVRENLSHNYSSHENFEFFYQGVYFDLYRSGENVPALLARVEARFDQSSGASAAKEYDMLAKVPEHLRPKQIALDISRHYISRPFRIEAFVPGKMCTVLNKNMVIGIAESLAELHRDSIVTDIERQNSLPGMHFKSLLWSNLPLREPLQQVQKIGQQTYESILKISRKIVLVHGDLHLENILSTEKGLCFIDWEHLGFDDAALDIAAFFWCSYLMEQVEQPLNDDLRTAFLQRYCLIIGDDSINFRLPLYEKLILVIHLLSWEIKAQDKNKDISERNEYQKLVQKFIGEILK